MFPKYGLRNIITVTTYTFLTWKGNTYGLSFVVSVRFYLNNNNKSVKKNKTSSEEEINRF
jgi:hypothetical protein